MTLAIVRGGVDVPHLARQGMSVGLMSAGIGDVSAERTFRDISAGNREPPPSDAVPGLLESALARAGLSERYRRAAIGPGELPSLIAGLRAGDLLIALAEPPPAENRALPIGIAGVGFDGTLTSDSTRTRGYVLSTDIAPTILTRVGLAIPNRMDGQQIRAEGPADVGAVEELGDRMAAIPERRGPVLILCLAVWMVLVAALALIRPSARRAPAAGLALAFAYLPLTLLLGAALEPSGVVEGLIVGLGAASLAVLTLRLLPGWRALGIACAASLVAYAIDVIAGSDLTRLSLLGPNPIYGARFYGIGNELEALFTVMVPVAVGAALTAAKTGWGKPVSERAGIIAFLGVAAIGAIVFGAGRFGADVGAAIVLPVGRPSPRRRSWLGVPQRYRAIATKTVQNSGPGAAGAPPRPSSPPHSLPCSFSPSST